MSDGIVAQTAELTGNANPDGGSSLESDSLSPFSEINGEEGESEVDAELEGEEGGEGDEELAPKEVEKEIKRLKKLKLKYNGKEYEEELPFEIDDNPEAVEYLTKQLQMAKMGQHKSQEYATLQGDIRQFVEELRTNPRKVLSDPNIGLDLKELAAQVLEEELENSQKSPEQLEKESLQKELEQLKSSQEKQQEEYRIKEMTRLQDQEFQRYDMLMNQALEGSDLPKSPYVVKKMADYMIMAINEGHDVEPSDILPIVREEILGDIQSMFEVMPADVISNILGKDTYDKVRKHKVSKARKTKSNAATNKKSPDVGQLAKVSAKASKEDEKTFKDFFGV